MDAKGTDMKLFRIEFDKFDAEANGSSAQDALVNYLAAEQADALVSFAGVEDDGLVFDVRAEGAFCGEAKVYPVRS
jgi:hypothetical protein